MARREYHVRIGCAQKGCGETQHFYPTTRADEARIYAGNDKSPWKCNRHAQPEENLRPGNEETVQVLVATRVKRKLDRWEAAYRQPVDCDPGYAWLDGLFWCPEGGPQHGSGFEFGPGFNAYASEFPEGTRLVVAARIEYPAQENADG